MIEEPQDFHDRVIASLARLETGQTALTTTLHTGFQFFKEENSKREDEIKAVESRLNTVVTKQSVMQWRLGTMSAGAGAALAFLAEWFAAKMGFRLTN